MACIGNSITDGFGIDMADVDGYPAQLQQLLGRDYYVRNFGVSGRTMLNHGNLPYMKERAWKEAQTFSPDIAIIKLGTNDSKNINWDTYAKDYIAGIERTEREKTGIKNLRIKYIDQCTA